MPPCAATAGASAEDDASQRILDGKAVALSIRQEIKAEVASMAVQPGLAVILVGSRRDSQTYVSMKKKACANAGILSKGFDFDESVTQDELLTTIQTLNTDPTIHGILVQLPLPSHIDEAQILHAVDPDKDVDGLHPVNVAKLQLYSGDALDAPFSIACTPLGCLHLLKRSDGANIPDLSGRNCVVVGRSHLVGLPMARLLLGAHATVTVVHSRTKNIESIVQQADVVVVAVGKAQLVTADWLRDGAVVLDVGINSIPNSDPQAKKPYTLVGDVDFASASGKCSKITPVPGGIGPMTIAMLLRNTVRACQRQATESRTPTAVVEPEPKMQKTER